MSSQLSRKELRSRADAMLEDPKVKKALQSAAIQMYLILAREMSAGSDVEEDALKESTEGSSEEPPMKKRRGEHAFLCVDGSIFTGTEKEWSKQELKLRRKDISTEKPKHNGRRASST